MPGKSTTVKILTGIIQDYTGEVTVFGKNLRENILEMKSKVGYVPELAELYDLLTPREYLTFVGKLYHLPDDIIEERSRKMLDSFSLLVNIDQREWTVFQKACGRKLTDNLGSIA